MCVLLTANWCEPHPWDRCSFWNALDVKCEKDYHHQVNGNTLFAVNFVRVCGKTTKNYSFCKQMFTLYHAIALWKKFEVHNSISICCGFTCIFTRFKYDDERFDHQSEKNGIYRFNSNNGKPRNNDGSLYKIIQLGSMNGIHFCDKHILANIQTMSP